MFSVKMIVDSQKRGSKVIQPVSNHPSLCLKVNFQTNACMLIYRMVLTTILLPSRKHVVSLRIRKSLCDNRARIFRAKKTFLRENTTTIVFLSREALAFE